MPEKSILNSVNTPVISEAEAAPIDLDRAGTVWLGGRPICVETTGRGRAIARLNGERLVVGGVSRTQSLAAIDRWYRREARGRIEAVARSEADRLGLEPGRITIRDQRTRWGSCSTSGTLSFNWRLVIGPGHALRYVVVHELIHIRHHNHSRAFWHALAEAMPDWNRSAAWLRSNERLLSAYRPAI